MRRCAICDATSDFSSLGVKGWFVPIDSRNIFWNKRHQEYQCRECYNSIEETRNELEEDIEIVETPETNNTDEVFEVPTSLPPLLVE
jgi:hypothetical protein